MDRRSVLFAALFAGAGLILPVNSAETRAEPLGLSGDDWIVSLDSDGVLRATSIGRLDFADRSSATFEPREESARATVALKAGAAILFYPPVDEEAARRFCERVVETRRRYDYVLLRNDDEFEGRYERIDRRFVYFRAFETTLRLPRGVVRATRLADAF